MAWSHLALSCSDLCNRGAAGFSRHQDRSPNATSERSVNLAETSTVANRRSLRIIYKRFCLAVTREGEVGAWNDSILLNHEPDSVSISEISHLYVAKEFGPEDARRARRAIAAEGLPDSWKTYFQEKLDRLNV